MKGESGAAFFDEGMNKLNNDLKQLTRSRTCNFQNGKSLTPKSLQLSGLKIIDSHSDSSVDITVYEDGNVLYRQHYPLQKSRYTVFDLRETVTAKLDLQDCKLFDFCKYDALLAITFFGDAHIAENGDHQEQNYVAHWDPELLEADDVLEHIFAQETSRELYAACQNLKPHHKEVILLYFFERMTEKEIAGKLGVPRTTVSSRKKAALNELAQKMKLKF